MADEKTQITTRLIADEAITKDKLNISVEGKAVIAKIVEEDGSGIKINGSTGADPGTGDVGLKIDWDALDARWYEESLTGTIDNANCIFTTTYQYKPGSTIVFRNGLEEARANYYEFDPVVHEKRILFSEAPRSNGFTDELKIRYIKI